jgi:hypothetical protein
MDSNAKLIDLLVERATEYGKTSLEVLKYKAIEKTSEVVSSIVPHSVVLVLIVFFLLFINFGLAFWLGEIFGKIYFGFFIVAGFYLLIGMIMHFFMHKWLKNKIGNCLIKQVLN